MGADLGVSRFSWMSWREDTVCACVGGQGRETPGDDTATVRANCDGGSRGGERWSASGNILKAEPADGSGVGV